MHIQEMEGTQDSNFGDAAATKAQTQPQGQTEQQNTQDRYSPSANSQDESKEWSQISDANDRRRLQNRIAQRNYRRKLKLRVEELESQLQSGANSRTNEQVQQQHQQPPQDTQVFAPVIKPENMSFMTCSEIPAAMTMTTMNPGGMFINPPVSQADAFVHFPNTTQPGPALQPLPVYRGPYPPLPEAGGLHIRYDDPQQYTFAPTEMPDVNAAVTSNPLRMSYSDAMYFESLFADATSNSNSTGSGERLGGSPSMQPIPFCMPSGSEQDSEEMNNPSSHLRTQSNASTSRPPPFYLPDTAAIPTRADSDIQKRDRPTTFPPATEPDFNCERPAKRARQDPEELRCSPHMQPQPNTGTITTPPRSNNTTAPRQPPTARDGSRSSPILEPRQPTLPLADASLTERMTYLVECTRAAGFSSFDAAATEYYTATFADKSEVNLAQKMSRSRRLDKLLASLHDSSQTWTRWETQGYQTEILRAAESMYTADFKNCFNAYKPFGAGSNSNSNNMSTKSDCECSPQIGVADLDSRSTSMLTPPSCGVHTREMKQHQQQPPSNNFADLSRWYQDELPKLWALFTELANHQNLHEHDSEHAVTVAIATLASKDGVGLRRSI